MSTRKLSADSFRRRPRRSASDGVLLVTVSQAGRYFIAGCDEPSAGAVSETSKDAVMDCAVRAWAIKKKDTVLPRQIAAKEIKCGTFETRCFRDAVPAIEPGPKPLALHSVKKRGRHA